MIALQPSSALWALPVLTLWAISPYFAYHTGLPRQGDRQVLDARERRELRQTARLTWRFFEEVVTAGDNWLVPDNYQENRPDPIAHRTSPTNIGLQMMAAVSAWDLGYLSAAECLTRLDRTVDSAAQASAVSRAFLQLVRHPVARSAGAALRLHGRQRQLPRLPDDGHHRAAVDRRRRGARSIAAFRTACRTSWISSSATPRRSSPASVATARAISAQTCAGFAPLSTRRRSASTGVQRLASIGVV